MERNSAIHFSTDYYRGGGHEIPGHALNWVNLGKQTSRTLPTENKYAKPSLTHAVRLGAQLGL